jgi:hypothetical protein
MSLVIDSFSFATLDASSQANVDSVSATLYLDNPTDIFVAQVALTQVDIVEWGTCSAYIHKITLLNGDFLEFDTFPRVIEWADTLSVTFVLAVGPPTSTGGIIASALASVTSYRET